MERVLMVLAAKEEELAISKRGKAKLHREVETQKKMIDGLNTSNSMKLAEINKLKEDLSHLKHELLERTYRIMYLSEEVVAEKRVRLDTQEQSRSDHLATQSLWAELKEEQIAHQTLREESIQAVLEAEQWRKSSLAKIQTLQARLAFLELEAHWFVVDEGYHHSALRKVEVALACKAGYGFLEAQLPVDLRSDLTDSTIPQGLPTI